MVATRSSMVGGRSVAGMRYAVGALLVALLLAPLGSAAQTCTDCDVTAATTLNLRQDPSVDAPILRVVPAGAAMQQSEGDETNGYVPVTYDRVPGWVVASGLEGSPAASDGSSGADTGAPVGGTSAATDDRRVTLAPLVTRRIPLDSLQQGMEETLRGGPVMKVLIDLAG